MLKNTLMALHMAVLLFLFVVLAGDIETTITIKEFIWVILIKVVAIGLLLYGMALFNKWFGD